MIRALIIVAALASTTLATTTAAWAEPVAAPAAGSGIIRRASAHSVDETVALLKADVEKKGIRFFSLIDQSDLGKDAKVTLNRSVLIQFGNPPLGLQFLTASPYAGLDWPVRMLVFQDNDGKVWIAYTDFAWIAKRHGIKSRDAQFRMASEVAASIARAAE